MFAQSLEAVRALEDGVLETSAKAMWAPFWAGALRPGRAVPFGWLDILGAQKAVEICDRLEPRMCPLQGAADAARHGRQGDSFYGRKAAA